MECNNIDNRWEKVLKFIEENIDAFDEYEIMRIKNVMQYGNFPKDYHVDLIRELCDNAGMIPEKDNMYLAFLKELIENFDIEKRNIVEVGGGIIPCLGRRISLLQTGGSITIYDPRIIDTIEGNEKFRLVKEKFTHSTDLGDTNLLIGLMPCEGAEVLIDKAIKHKIDFMVWLCEGGPHGDYFDFYEDDEEWLCAILSYAKRGVSENNMGQLKKKYLERFSKEFPIISSKKI